jgi:hypothetical protein
MKIIAIEEHFLPPRVMAAWGKTAADDPTKALQLAIIESRLGELRPGSPESKSPFRVGSMFFNSYLDLSVSKIRIFSQV